MKLFEDNWGVDESPTDDTEITTTILYFSKDELKKFKSLCKKGMKFEYGNEAFNKGNLSNFLLKILKKYENV